jgi:AcrR family transcriptional regulator
VAVDPRSREALAAAGLELLDREGLDALTMRRLATAAGVGTMTLYGYFRDKDDLLDAVIDAAAARHAIPELRGDWRAQLRTLFAHFEAVLAAHPALVAVRLRRPILTTGGFRVTEQGMRILLEAGFDRAQAARAFRALFVHSFGSAGLRPHGGNPGEDASVRAAIAALPAAEFPALAASAPELAATMEPDAQFAADLELILDGLAARLRPPR